MNEKCPECGKDKNEYDPKWPCSNFHRWQASWRKDKKSPRYQEYLKRRHKSMTTTLRKKLEDQNKKPLHEKG